MQKKILFCLLILCLSLNLVLGATPTIYDFKVTNNVKYTNQEVIQVDINADGNASCFRFWDYSKGAWGSSISYQGITYDLNLVEYGMHSDGNKTIEVRVCEACGTPPGGAQDDKNCATDSTWIVVDLTPPETKTNYDGNWKNADFDVKIWCNDNWKMNKMEYKIDSDESANISYGNLQEDTQEPFEYIQNASVDGNYALYYRCIDEAGNDTNTTIFLLLDKENPALEDIELPSDVQNLPDDLNISFEIKNVSVGNEQTSSIDINATKVYIDSAASEYFKPWEHCKENSGNFTCEYTEYGLKETKDYNVCIYAYDEAGNVDNNCTTIDVNDTLAPKLQPCTQGGFLEEIPSSNKIEFLIYTCSGIQNYYDLKEFYIYRDTNSNLQNKELVGKLEFNQSNCTYDSFNDFYKCRYADTNNLQSDTNYWYYVLPKDLSGNLADDINGVGNADPWSMSISSLDTPTITSSTHQENSWNQNKEITFSWNAISGASKYCYAFNQNSSTTPNCSNSTTSTTLDINASDDGTYYFHLKACNDAETVCSEVDHYTVKVDTTKPSAPTNLSTSVSGSNVTISWNAVSDTSGISKYYVYRCTSSATSSCSKIGETSSTSYTNSGLSNGTYYYRIKAVDNAENISDYSSYKSATVNVQQDTGCDYSININVPSYVKAETITITATPSSGSLYSPTMKIKTYGKNYGERFSNYSLSGSRSSISNNYSFKAGDDGTAYVWVIAEDDDGDSCSYTKTFIVDTLAPSISWKEPTVNAVLKGKVMLKVEAKDIAYGNADKAAGIKSVSMYYIKDGKETKITSFSVNSNNLYTIEWDTAALENGSYTLKAVAKDNAGNEAYAEIAVTIKNLSEEEKKIVESLDDLKNKFEELKEKEFVGELLKKLEEVEEKINNAESNIENENYSDANNTIEEANKLLEDINNSKITEEFEKSKEYKNIEESVNLLENYKDEALETMQDLNVAREFKIMEIQSEDENYSQAVVKIKIKNTANKTKEVQLLEVIPKEFVESASMIKSNVEFEIIKEDPVIKFEVSLNANEEKEITYWVDKKLSENEVEQKKLAFEKFSYAPLALPNTADVNESVISFEEKPAIEETTEEKTPTAAATAAQIDPIIIIVGILVIIAIAAIALSLFRESGERPKEKRKRFAYVPEREEKRKEDFEIIFRRNRDKEGLERFRY